MTGWAPPQGRSERVRENLASTGIRSPVRPACSESLYRLSYPSPPRSSAWPVNGTVTPAGTLQPYSKCGVGTRTKYVQPRTFLVVYQLVARSLLLPVRGLSV